MGFNNEGILKDTRDEFRALVSRSNAAFDLLIANKAALLDIRDITIANNPTVFNQEHIDDINAALASLNARKSEI
jgi:hypothetical protein